MEGRGIERNGLRGNRRWFLGVAGGAAASILAGCGDNDTPATRTPGRPQPEDEPPASSTPTRASGGSPQRGDTLRYTGFVKSDGVFDPHKTQAGPFYGQQALAFSRLLAYRNQLEGTVVPDLAADAPQRPDAQTFIFRLRPAKWHDIPPLNGRTVTAEDVKFSFERQRDGNASFVRQARLKALERVEVLNPSELRFTFATPLATLEHLFADVNSFVVAPEHDAGGYSAERQAGSGPFRWVEWSESQPGARFASVARNPEWSGGGGRPYLDGVDIREPASAAEIEGWLRTKKVDVAFVGRPEADALKKAIPELEETQVGQLLFFGMRFYLPAPPYNDPRVRTALSIAVDRREMVKAFFSGSAQVNPWVAWPLKRWSLPQSELTGIAGYRPGVGGREQDIREAKAMLAGYASERRLPDELGLLVVEDAERALRLGSVIRGQLAAALGLNVTVYPVPTAQLIDMMKRQEAPWAAGPDSSGIDLDDCLYPYFHQEGTHNTFAMRDPDMDALIARQRLELDERARREIGYEIQRKLFVLNPGANFLSETVVALRWPYVRNFPFDAADGYQNRFADCWIDRSDPTVRGR